MRKTLIAAALLLAAATTAEAQTCGFVTREQLAAGAGMCASKAPEVLRPLPLPEKGEPRIIRPLPAKPRIIYPSPAKPTDVPA